MPYGGLFKVDNRILNPVLVSGLLFLLRPQSLKYRFRKQSDNERNLTLVLFAVDNQLFSFPARWIFRAASLRCALSRAGKSSSVVIGVRTR